MISKILAFLGDANDVRTVAALVAGVLTTLFRPGDSTTVVAVVDAFAGFVVTVDTAIVAQAKSKAPVKTAPAPVPAPAKPVTVEGPPAA